MKNPVILFSISSLCRTFEEWIPKLHEAMKSCIELNVNHDDSHTEIDLKSFLDGSAFDDVSYLAQMCFDCGVYGLEGLELLDDVYNQKKRISETSSNGCLLVQDTKEVTDEDISRDVSSDNVVSSASDKCVEGEFAKCIPISYESGERSEETKEADKLCSADTNTSTPHTVASTPPSTSSGVMEEVNFNVKAFNEDPEENTLETAVDNGNSDSGDLLSTLAHDVNGTIQNHTDNDVSSHEVVSRNSLLSQSTISSLQSEQSCERKCWQCENESAFCRRDNGKVSDDSSVQQQDDSIRSRFLSYYFFLLDAKRLRRTLLMSRGDRGKTWRTFIDCLSGG